MASTIKLKRSSVAGKTPNTTNLSTGELALNLADKRLYSANSSAILEIGSNPDSLSVGSGGFTIANGAITFPLADGDANQVLQTDGSGQLSFGTVSGGDGGQTANVSLFANATTNLVTTQISTLQINDRVVANPDGFIKLLTGNAQELRVPYFGAPGVNLDNGIISVTGGVSVNATFTNYFGQVDADGTNIVAQSPNNQLSIIGSDTVTIQGFTGNNTVKINTNIANTSTSSASLDNNIVTFTRADSSTFELDLTGIANTSTSSASLSGNTVTFTRNDSSSYTLDVSNLAVATATVSDTPPTSPQNGDLWFDSSTASLFLYYDDGSSQQWVDPSSIPVLALTSVEDLESDVTPVANNLYNLGAPEKQWQVLYVSNTVSTDSVTFSNTTVPWSPQRIRIVSPGSSPASFAISSGIFILTFFGSSGMSSNISSAL